jgi:RNA polymerase sigma factor (sigma-70 family)
MATVGDASGRHSLARLPRSVARLHGREVQFTEIEVDELSMPESSMMNTNGLVTRLLVRSRDCAHPATDGSHPATDGSQPEVDGGKTNASLLGQVRDWGNGPAWGAFFERYDSLLRSWCRRIGVRGDAGDELCQRIWIELMQRMQTFRYDPSLGFRGWLWRLFRCRAIDLLRQTSAAQQSSLGSLGNEECELIAYHRDLTEADPNAIADSLFLVLCDHAAEVQRLIQTRVDPETWQAFWLVAIEDCSVREAAQSLGKTYTAVYTGYKRVDRMLRDEGARRLALLANLPPIGRDANFNGEPATGH